MVSQSATTHERAISRLRDAFIVVMPAPFVLQLLRRSAAQPVDVRVRARLSPRRAFDAQRGHESAMARGPRRAQCARRAAIEIAVCQRRSQLLPRLFHAFDELLPRHVRDARRHEDVDAECAAMFEREARSVYGGLPASFTVQMAARPREAAMQRGASAYRRGRR